MLIFLLSLIGKLLRLAIDAYILILFIRMILDWISVLAPTWRPTGTVREIINIIYGITEPPLHWLRQFVPSIPLGSIRLDVSFIVLWFLLLVARMLVAFIL